LDSRLSHLDDLFTILWLITVCDLTSESMLSNFAHDSAER
jgi:hypothetical protein